MSIPVVFDLDDSGLITHPTIIKILHEAHGEDLPIDQYLTPDNGGTGFIGLMESGEFLDKVSIRPTFIAAVKRLKEAGHPVLIGSHRGYHKLGRILTRKLFTAEEWELFDYHVFLDPISHPDKIEYFDEYFNGEPYLIVDDRPHFNSDYDREDADKIILFDQPWNKNLPFERVSDFDENFFELVSEKTEILSNF